MKKLIFFLFFTGFHLFLTPCLAEVKKKRMVVIGDSLTEGYGVSKETAFPAVLEKKLLENKKNWSVINSGISGSTSASGLSRLKWQLKSKPDLILIALGANDGLRGFKPEVTEKNLSEILELAKAEKIKAILCGMMMPPNYGAKYQKEFSEVYPRLAKKYNVPLIEFFLRGVAGQPEYNLEDGIHPNEKGHQKIAENIFREIGKNL